MTNRPPKVPPSADLRVERRRVGQGIPGEEQRADAPGAHALRKSGSGEGVRAARQPGSTHAALGGLAGTWPEAGPA
jgi:hypothetical protein